MARSERKRTTAPADGRSDRQLEWVGARDQLDDRFALAGAGDAQHAEVVRRGAKASNSNEIRTDASRASPRATVNVGGSTSSTATACPVAKGRRLTDKAVVAVEQADEDFFGKLLPRTLSTFMSTMVDIVELNEAELT